MPESAKKKFYVNGIEIVPKLAFNGWQPGFEYIKNITLKNLNTRSVKILYIVPRTRFFTTLHPKILSLSPGTTFTLPITFRPLEKIRYEDCVEVNLIDFQKTFKIPLTAELPQFKMDVPKELDMGPCAAGEYLTKQIRIKNLSELDTMFEWDFRGPFTITPVSGELPAHSSMDISILFQPTAALIYRCLAVCRYGAYPLKQSKLHKTFEIHGTGKYPHLLLEDDTCVSSTASLDFGRNIVGQSITKYVTVINMTEVTTNYFIERQNEIPIFDTSFNCLQLMGCLQPFERQKIPIVYSSNLPDEDTKHDYFNVYSSGKLSKNIISCKASNLVPRVEMDKDIIDFELCLENQRVVRVFNLINISPIKLAFQFDIDSRTSTFEFSLTNGTLEPHEKKLIQVFFKPQFASIYYKKVPCIIQDHNVLYIQMIGTTHSELVKPPVLNRTHIENYYFLKNEGLLHNTPEQLMELYMKRKFKFDEKTIHEDYVAKMTDPNGALLTEEYICDREHFYEPKSLDDINTQVIVDAYYVDFGASVVDPMNEDTNDQRSITVTNKTRGKILMQWNNAEDQAFTIEPLSCEIPPLKNYSFRVKFRPKAESQFYNMKLEGYAFYNALTNYTLAEAKFVVPSWCLNIECLGHTFNPSNDTHFIPKYTIDAENVIFPVTTVDKTVYRTLTVKNLASNYPLAYDFATLNNDEWFVKPHRGLIKRDEHQTFIFRFTPKVNSYFVDKCEIMLNSLAKHMLEVALVGTGATPTISLENQGFLYFSPTCKNNFMTHEYEIVNLSRGRLNYEWKIPFECRKLLAVDEVSGTLEPHEVKKSMWRFSPDKVDKYNMTCILVSWIEADKKDAQLSKLRALAECTHGSLQSADMYVDFGSVIVGSSVSQEITVINNNDCPLDYELFVKQTSDEDRTCNELCVLEIEEPVGHVEARSRQIVRCRLRPTKLISYQFTVEYRIIYPNEAEADRNDKRPVSADQNPDTPRDVKELLCYMTANGVYPKMKIKDIKCIGSASTLSQDYFWKLLSIDHFNTALNNEPNSDELVYSIATRQEANRRQCSNNSKVIIEMNFGAAPIKSEDTKIIFFVENVGTVPSEWALLYPKDLLIELEYWAQNGDYDLDELEEMKVQDNKLFSIEPKKGFLDPGQSVQIHVTYKHIFAGVNKLPVLFKMLKGREILLNMVGTTVAHNEPNIHFPNSLYEFEPIEIGLSEYPIQIYEIYNGGNVACDVEIDASALDNLNAENYSRAILKYLTENKIQIQPGSLFETKWIFSPIEAKTYTADIKFLVNGKDMSVVTLKCIGYDKKSLNNMTIASKMHEESKINSRLLPNQLASLSMDRISLGDIPLFTRERKMFFIKNNSSKNRITFTWHVTNPEHGKFIRIQPAKGAIETGQNKMCKVTFMSVGKPSFYNIDLICEVKNDSDQAVYRKELEAWQREQTRQFEEFIIDNDELENRLNGSPRTPEVTKDKKNSSLSIHRFKTIPPIMKNMSIEESHVDKVRRERAEKKVWKKPLPPTPYLMHLNIIARTQYIEEFLSSKNTVKNECVKFFDASLGNLLDGVPAGAEAAEEIKTIRTTKEEKESLDFIMSDLIKNLTSDKSFHSLILKLKDEPVPYFFQYSDNAVPSVEAKESSESMEHDVPTRDEFDAHALKSSPEFGSLIEGLLENTISNILTEAFNKEFSLTSRPRLIALPPKTAQSQVLSNPLSSPSQQAMLMQQRKKTPTMDVMSVVSAASRSKPASKHGSKPGSAMSAALSVTRSVDLASNALKSDPLATDIPTIEVDGE